MPIQAISANIPVNSKGKEKTITIGYVYEMNGKTYVIIEPTEKDLSTFEEKSGCAPWMFLGFLFPPIFLVALYVMFIKNKD